MGAMPLRLRALVAPSPGRGRVQTLGPERSGPTDGLGSGSRRSATKLLLGGASALLIYWTSRRVKLVLSARGINPLLKPFSPRWPPVRSMALSTHHPRNYRSSR